MASERVGRARVAHDEGHQLFLIPIRVGPLDSPLGLHEMEMRDASNEPRLYHQILRALDRAHGENEHDGPRIQPLAE